MREKDTLQVLISNKPEVCIKRLHEATLELSKFISEKLPRNKDDLEITGFNPHSKYIISSYFKNPETGKGVTIFMNAEGVYANELGDPRLRLRLDLDNSCITFRKRKVV